jgi:hypothetical protein
MKYNIDRSVIGRTLSGERTTCRHLGRNSTLPLEMETLIADYVLKMDDAGFGINKKVTKQIAVKIFEKMGEKFKAKKFTASRMWYKRFLQRHPQISERRAQGFSRLRAGGLNREAVSKYLNILMEAHLFCIENSDTQCTTMDGNFVHNLDESAVAVTENGADLILSKRGKKAVHKLNFFRTVATRISSVNVVTGGEHIFHPSYIIEGKKMPPEQIVSDGSLDCLGTDNAWTMTENGFMTEKAWEEMVIPDYIRQVNKMRENLGKPNDWVLLIVDGFAAHSYSVRALEDLAANKIKCIRMPSHTSSALQALDVAVFKPVKVCFRDVINAHLMYKNTLTKYDLARLFHKSWLKVIHQSDDDETGQYKGKPNYLGRAGMKASGAFPLNMNWLDDHEETVRIADIALSTGAGSNNSELAVIAIAEETNSLIAVETLSYARKLLAHPQLQNLLQEIEKQTDLDASGFMQLLNRVATKEFIKETPIDQVMQYPWWCDILKEFKELPDNVVSGSSDESSDEESDEDGRGVTTFSSESKSSALDLNSPRRIAALKLRKEQLAELEREKVAKAKEKAEKRSIAEERHRNRHKEVSDELIKEEPLVRELTRLGWVSTEFYLKKETLSKQLLIQFLKSHDLDSQCKQYLMTTTAIQSFPKGLQSAVVNPTILVDFLLSLGLPNPVFHSPPTLSEA